MTYAAPSIGIVSSSISRAAGGIQATVVEHAAGLRRLGCKVSLMSLEDEFTRLDWPELEGVDISSHKIVGPKSFGYSPGLLRSLMSKHLDVVHLHGMWMYPSVAVSHWRRSTRGSLIITPHGMLDAWALRNSRLKKRVAGLLYENANLAAASCLHALNGSEARSIRNTGLRNPIAILPNGVKPPRNSILGKADWMVSDPRKVLVFIGRIHKKKGLRRALLAWSALLSEWPELGQSWQFVIAGWTEDGHQAELEQLVQKEGLGRHVRFLGPVYGEAKHILLSNSCAFILPSYSEGLPVSALEALSYGLPGFMTKECNLPEAFAAGVAFEISGESSEMARQMSRRIGDLSCLARARDQARDWVQTNFSWDRILPDLVDVYGWSLGAIPVPKCVSSGT